MKLFDKIKNILFEEEEVEVPVTKNEELKDVTKEIKTVEKTDNSSRFKNINYERNEVEKPAYEQKPIQKEASPFQQFDEEEFDRIAALNKSRLMERDRRAREEKEKEDSHVNSYYQEVKHENVRSTYVKPNNHLDNVIKKESTNEAKRFTPSPVISPVYGILDKNYKKEDILPKASSEGTLPKVIDVDSVRQKAFGALEEDIIEAHKKDDKIELLEESSDVIQDDGNDELINTSNIKITSFEDEIDSENDKVSDEVDNTVEEPIIIDDKEEPEEIANDSLIDDGDVLNEEKIKEDKKDEDSLESDLFNLIDSMYQDKEENK